MRCMIFAYNPNFIAQDVLSTFKYIMENKFNCYIYFIPHHDPHTDPIYCVEFMDTE